MDMGLDLYSKRFFAALLASCLLHGALVFMPYFGAGPSASRPAARGGQKPGPRVLNVRLVVLEIGAAASAAETPRPAAERAVGIGLLPIPAPAYYTTDQLTQRPRPTAEPRLDVPEIGPMFASGKVILKVWINELGNVDSVDVEKSELAAAVAATAAAAFGKLRFVPGEINGRPVGSMMRIEVTYDDGTRPP